MRVLDSQPFLEQSRLLHDCIVVYLIATANHYMKRFRLVRIEYVSP